MQALEKEKIETVKTLDSKILLERFSNSENIFNQFFLELKTMPNNDRIIQTLIRHYKKSVHLNHIINQLKSVLEYQKEKHYESINL